MFTNARKLHQTSMYTTITYNANVLLKSKFVLLQAIFTQRVATKHQVTADESFFRETTSSHNVLLDCTIFALVTIHSCSLRSHLSAEVNDLLDREEGTVFYESSGFHLQLLSPVKFSSVSTPVYWSGTVDGLSLLLAGVGPEFVGLPFTHSHSSSVALTLITSASCADDGSRSEL